MPFFSIVVPVYNTEPYLETCLNSLVNQSFDDIEIVVVDDASTDGSAAVIRRFAEQDRRIVPVQHDVNKGRHAVRTTGVAQAGGDYIFFVDSDDELRQDTCERLHGWLVDHDVDILHYGSLVVAENGVVPENAESFTHSIATHIGSLVGDEIVRAAFSDKVDVHQDWRINNHVYRSEVAKRAFDRMTHQRLDYAEDAYECFSIACEAETADTFDECEGYIYHYGRGITGEHPLSREEFAGICAGFADSMRHMREFVEDRRTPAIEESLSGFFNMNSMLISNDWVSRVAADDKRAAIDDFAGAFGDEATAYELYRFMRDRAYDLLQHDEMPLDGDDVVYFYRDLARLFDPYEDGSAQDASEHVPEHAPEQFRTMKDTACMHLRDLEARRCKLDPAFAFARIMFVGEDLTNRPEDFRYRMLDVLRRVGHAVCCTGTLADDDDAAARITALARTFKPSLVIWDVRSQGAGDAVRDWLASLSCCKVAFFEGDAQSAEVLQNTIDLFDFVLMPTECHDVVPADKAVVMSPRPDTRYRLSALSDPNIKRWGYTCTQSCMPERAEQIEAAITRIGGGSFLALDSSWPQSICERYPCGNAAFYLRMLKYCVYFCDDQPPLLSDIALRDSEDLLILVEEGIDVALDGADTMVRFASGQLAETIESFERDNERYATALTKQHNLFESMAPLEESLISALSDVDTRMFERAGKTIFTRCSSVCNVAMLGWFGAQNFGDDLLMRIVATRIEQHYENPHILIIGADAPLVMRQYGYEATTLSGKNKVAEFLKESSVLVYCGGLLFDDPMAGTAGELEFLFDPEGDPAGQASAALLARLYNVTSVFLGIGAGPLALDATQQTVRLMGLSGARFLTRDQLTSDYILASGVNADQVQTKTDLAFGARDFIERYAGDIPDALQGHPYMVVSLRRWHRCPSDFEQRIAAALDRVIDEVDITIAFVPFDPDDVNVHRKVCEAMTHADRVLNLEERPSESELLALMRGSRAALAMRLHCSIIHHVLGKPAVGLNYNDKVEAHFEQVKRTRYLCDLDVSSADLAQTISMALAQDTLGEETTIVIESNAALVDESFDEFFSIIDTHEPYQVGQEIHYPRRISRTRQEKGLLEAELHENESALQQMRDRGEAAADELDRVYGSRSWKVARTFARGAGVFRRNGNNAD